MQRCVTTVEHDGKRAHVLAIVIPEQMRGLLERVWDPAEFRSDYGLRSLSKCHERRPFRLGGAQVGYEPAESREMLKGGNSNWRGLLLFYEYFNGDTGMGLGASHQTGWSGLVASLIDEWRK
ncbi:MAG TPA: hypothetical protein VF508_11845 [Pyrinomonadaceae bacterium]